LKYYASRKDCSTNCTFIVNNGYGGIGPKAKLVAAQKKRKREKERGREKGRIVSNVGNY